MTTGQTSALLGFICGIELRPTVPAGAVEAWHDVLADVDFDAAMAAVRKHYRLHETAERPPRLTPYAIRTAARRGDR